MANEKESANTSEDKTLFSRSVHKKMKDGSIAKSWNIQSKVYQGHKFIQIEQEKKSFGNKPGSVNRLTLDPANKELREALTEAYNSFK
jgi:hemerythrin superfamily protein